MDETVSLRGVLGDQDLAIEPPRPSDIPSILALTKVIALDEPAWRSLFAAKNAICAKTSDGRLAGVYVANHYSLIYHGEQFDDLRGGISVLCNRFKLADTSIAFGAQVVIAAEWANNDLRGHLLRALLRTVGLRYRHLFSFCRKDNPLELHTLQHEGWRCFQEEDETCYLMLDAAKALRGLASQLVLRIPHQTERVPASTSIRA